MVSSASQKLELLIEATTKKQAETILQNLNIERLKLAGIAVTGNSCIAAIDIEPHLTDEEYDLIRVETQVAILQDSDSRIRASEIMDKIYEVEMRFRTIVMYMPPKKVELFHTIARQGRIKQYANDKMVVCGMLDTIADQLTFGEMIRLLSLDTFIGCSNAPWGVLGDVVDSSKDFDDFKNKFSDQLKHQLVWDIITSKILDKPISWDKIKNDFLALEKARNNAAHFHTITESEKEQTLRLADEILIKTKLKDRVNKQAVTSIAKQLSSFPNHFSSMLLSVTSNFSDYYSSIVSNFADIAPRQILLDEGAYSIIREAMSSLSSQELFRKEILQAFNNKNSILSFSSDDFAENVDDGDDLGSQNKRNRKLSEDDKKELDSGGDDQKNDNDRNNQDGSRE